MLRNVIARFIQRYKGDFNSFTLVSAGVPERSHGDAQCRETLRVSCLSQKVPDNESHEETRKNSQGQHEVFFFIFMNFISVFASTKKLM